MDTNQSGLRHSALFRAAAAAGRSFDAGRAVRHSVQIWEQARWMDTPAAFQAAACAAAILRQSGITDVRLEEVPADGKTAWNGWLMPLAWEVKEARLEGIGQSREVESFADYSLDPQCIAVGSPSTARGGFVEGRVVRINDATSVKGKRLKGCFLLLSSGKGSPELAEEAAKRGAMAVLTTTQGPTADARAYLNYSIPMDAERACVPCFSLSRESVGRLSARLDSNPGFRLRARVRARRYAGTAPMLTGTVGSGQPEIYLCAHIDEIGALDNASGCGVAIEALCTMQRLLTARKERPSLRTIRFFFSTEVRGQQAWFNTRQSPLEFLGGLNLDMIGSAAPDEPIVGRLGFPHHPHFAGRLMADAISVADQIVKGLPTALGANYVSDGIPGIHGAGGNVSIEQKPGPTYHTSADTPALLSRRVMRWGGIATVAWLYAMTRMHGTDALRVARKIRAEVAADIKKRDGATEKVRALAELRSLVPAIPASPAYGVADTPAGLYAAGVNYRSGRWPGIAQETALRSLIDSMATTGKPAATAASRRKGKPADRLVPWVPSYGFLNFEGLSERKLRRDLKRRTGLDVGWCTEWWAWVPTTFFDGKHTVSEVVSHLARLGIQLDEKRIVALVEFLVDAGLARSRPVLSIGDIKDALQAVGVKRGSTLLVHASLSAFGYMEGGAATVVGALRDVLGPKGSLIMPTHSASLLGREPYVAARSPSLTGAVTEFFRNLPGVVRSAHPTHSVAGIGPIAEAIIKGHAGDVARAPLARDGFWGRFYDAGGDVLLMCPISSATAFHAGETWLNLPQPPIVAHSTDAVTGRRKVYTLPCGPWHTDHFEKTMARPLMRKGVMKTHPLGESAIHLAPVREMIDISVEVNRRNPLVSIGRNGACTCYYCRGLREGLTAGKHPLFSQ